MPITAKIHKLYAKLRDRGHSPEKASMICDRLPMLSRYVDHPPERCETCKKYDCTCGQVAKYAAQQPIARATIDAFKKQIAKLDDSADPMGTVGGDTVWMVDGDGARLDYGKDFAGCGGNSRCPFIPKGEIWVDETMEPQDYRFAIFREAVHSHLVGGGMGHAEAHSLSSAHEKAWRIQDDLDTIAAKTPCSQCDEPHCEHVAAMVTKYAKEKYRHDQHQKDMFGGEQSHWITIGGQSGEGGKHHGGVHVEVKGGTIIKGPEKMVGNSPDNPVGSA